MFFHVRKESAFTLVELLVVIAIIAIVASMTFPAMGKAKAQGVATVCLNNSRQIGLTMAMFADDTGGAFPGSEHQGKTWVAALLPYGGGKGVYRCPADKNTNRVQSYAINDFLLPPLPGSPDYSKASSIAGPSETITFPECAAKYDSSDHYHFALPDDGGYTPPAFEGQVGVRRHQNAANYVYVDGHVERVRWTPVRTRLTAEGSRFVNPGGHKP